MVLGETNINISIRNMWFREEDIISRSQKKQKMIQNIFDIIFHEVDTSI